MPATFAPIAALFNDFTSKSLPLRGTDMTVVVIPPRVPCTAVGVNLLHLPPISPRTVLVSLRRFFLSRQLNSVNVAAAAAKFAAVTSYGFAKNAAGGYTLPLLLSDNVATAVLAKLLT